MEGDFGVLPESEQEAGGLSVRERVELQADQVMLRIDSRTLHLAPGAGGSRPTSSIPAPRPPWTRTSFPI